MSISVTLMPDPGAPQVGVTVAGLSSPAVISVQRSHVPGEWSTVIGALSVEAFGSYFVRDFLVPLNVDTTYRVVVESGTITGDTEASITVSSDWAWIQDPRDPRGACRVTCEGDPGDGERGLVVGSFASAQYRQGMDLVQPLGARLPVASLGQRMLAGEVPLVLSYDVMAEGGELQRLLMDSGELVLRGHNFSMLEPVAHIAIGDAVESQETVFTSPRTQISTWDLSVTQVRPAALRLVIAWWTYAQVEELWGAATYSAAYAARPGDTYLDWQVDPEPP